MSVTQTRAVFEKAMKSFGFPNGEKIAVAVSGGADSTAFCLLAREFVRQNGGEILALIVDHGLRPCSAQQARLTAELQKTEGELSRLDAKLGNPGFLAKAPAAVVEGEREKQKKFNEQKEAILAALAKLG